MPKELSYEDAVAMSQGGGTTPSSDVPELSYEDALKKSQIQPIGATQPLTAPAPKREMTYEEAMAHQEATYGSALGASIVQGTRKGVGGVMEATGEALAPVTDRSYADIALGTAKAVGQGGGLPAVVGGFQQAGVQAGRDIGKALGLEQVEESPALKQFRQDLAGSGKELAAEAEQAQRVATPEDLNILQRASISAIGSAAQITPTALLARYGKIGAPFAEAVNLGAFGFQSFGQTYADARAKGAAPYDAFKAAAISGGAEVWTEKLGLDALFRRGDKWMREFVAKEIGGEELATISQSLAEKGIYNPEKWSTLGEIGTDLLETALGAAMGAGAITGVDKAVSMIEAKKKVNTEQEQARIKEELAETLRQQMEAQQGQRPDPVTEMKTTAAAAPPTELPAALTPEQEASARVMEAQLEGKVNVAGTPEAQAFGASLDRLNAGIAAHQAEVEAEGRAVYPDIGGSMSPEVVARKAATAEEEADKRDIADKPISYTTGESDVNGLSLRQTGIPGKGSVTAVGGSPRFTPIETVQTIADTLHQFMQKYMPNARIIMNLDQTAAGVYGWHNVVSHNGELVHIINPMEFPTVKYSGGNIHSMMSVITAVTHEFGHALKMQSLYGNMQQRVGAELTAQVMNEVQAGAITPETLAALQAKAGTDANMIAEWHAKKQRILSGQMSAIEFMNEWVGTRKLGEDVAVRKESEKDRYAWARQTLGRDPSTATALELVTAAAGQGNEEKYLSLDEYMAEQFSRHAYSSGELAASKYGQWFSTVMSRLRDLFRTLKMEHMVAPHTTFAEWVNETSRYNLKRKARKPGDFVLSKELTAAREKYRQVQEDIKAAEEQLKKEEAEAKRQKDEAIAKAQKVETRTREDVRKAKAAAKTEDAELSLFAYQQKVLQMGLEDRRAELAKYPRNPKAKDDYKLRRQMLMDAVAELEMKEPVEKEKKPRAPPRKKIGEGARGQVIYEDANGVRSYTEAKFKYVEKPNQPRSDEFMTIEELDAREPPDAEIPEITQEVKRGGKAGWGKAALTPKTIDPAFEEHQARLLSTLEDNAGLLSDAQYISIARLIEVGSLKQAEARLEKAINGEEHNDRDASVKAFNRTPKKASVWARAQKAITEKLRNLPLLPEIVGRLPAEHRHDVVWGAMQMGATRLDDKAIRYLPRLWGPTAEVVEAELGAAFREGRALVRMPVRPATLDATRGYATEVVRDEAGTQWLEVDPVNWGVKNAGFDPANPMASRALPGVSLAVHAGMENASLQDVEAHWKAHKIGSPFFKRWFGKSQVMTPTFDPQKVWRSVGGGITYVGANLQGSGTAGRGIWFSSVPSAGYPMNAVRTIEDGVAQRTSSFYLRMENPYVYDASYQDLEKEQIDDLVTLAYGGGHDGLIVRNLLDDQASDHFILWDTANIALDPEVTHAPEEDTFHYDRDGWSQTVKGVHNGLKKFGLWGLGKYLNNYARLVDSLVQLQQRAHTSPNEIHLNGFVKDGRLAEEVKGRLQKDAEEFVKKELMKIGHSNPQAVRLLEKLLRYEVTVDEEIGKEAELMGTMQLKQGDLVLNPNGEVITLQMLQQADNVEFTFTPENLVHLNSWAASQGLKHGDALLERVKFLYLKSRGIMAQQFLELGHGELIANNDKFGMNPLLQQRDQIKIVEMMRTLLTKPFTPQGNFGNYVVTVKEKITPAAFGPGPHYRLVRREHFETKEERDAHYEKWLKARRGNPDLDVTAHNLEDDDQHGLPMQLPADIMERIILSGVYSEDQVVKLGELMSTGRIDRISERFERMSAPNDGTSTDFGRTFADFTWRNSNYIWKRQFSAQLKNHIKAAKGEIRKIEKLRTGDVTEQIQIMDMKRRNIALMEKGLSYMLNPPNEFQGVRSIVTMLFLAMNIKTVLMNFSTMTNTYVGVVGRLGDIKGAKTFGQGLKDATFLMLAPEKYQTDWLLGQSTERMQELATMFGRAKDEGIIDQSYAYYLAGHANGKLSNYATSPWKSAGNMMAHNMMEWGMMPFQWVETANRVAAMVTFYDAVKQEQGEDFSGKLDEAAYQEAVRQTELLQNSYTAMNRMDITRGGKGWRTIMPLATIFTSYTQFMWFIMSGKYERGERARAKAEGRYYVSAWRGPTMRLWIMYLYLAGLMGIPFAANIMDIMQVLYRKFTSKNLEVEAREMLKSYGFDSNLAFHGRLHNAFGFDLSGSFGLGRMFPGTDMLSKRAQSSSEMMGNMFYSMFGVFGSLIKSGVEFGTTLANAPGGLGSPVSWTEAMGKLPGAGGNFGKAMNAYLKQEMEKTAAKGITTRTGQRILRDPETGELRDLTPTEMAGQMLGFNPTIKAEGFQRSGAAKAEVMYWQLRHADLVERYTRAVQANDTKAVAVVRADKEEFNKVVPNFRMRITDKDLHDASKRVEKNNALREKYGTESKKYREVGQRAYNAYE